MRSKADETLVIVETFVISTFYSNELLKTVRISGELVIN